MSVRDRVQDEPAPDGAGVLVAAFADGVADGAINDVVLGNHVAVLADGALGEAGTATKGDGE